jgi:hypothetical protein
MHIILGARYSRLAFALWTPGAQAPVAPRHPSGPTASSATPELVLASLSVTRADIKDSGSDLNKDIS